MLVDATHHLVGKRVIVTAFIFTFVSLNAAHAIPALAATECDINTAPLEDLSACVDFEGVAQYDISPEGNALCGQPCPSAGAEATLDGEATIDIDNPGSGDEDPAIYSLKASFGFSECIDLGDLIASCTDEEEPSEEVDPIEEEGPEETPSARAVHLEASHEWARPQDTVTFVGSVKGPDYCAAPQPVTLTAKRPGEAGFQALRNTTTEPDGTFRFEITVGRATEFQAMAPGSDACEESVSPVVVVAQAA